jgi:hypothetical protein
MGGVHFFPLEEGTIEPLIWRAPFPADITKRLMLYDNPAGTITNSELELAGGGVAQFDVLAQHFDIRERTVHNSSDNVTTVWWQRKGAVSSSGPRLTCYASKPFISATFAMSLSMTTSQGRPTSCHMTAVGYGTSLTANCLPISIHPPPRVGPGAYANCDRKCTDH